MGENQMEATLSDGEILEEVQDVVIVEKEKLD